MHLLPHFSVETAGGGGHDLYESESERQERRESIFLSSLEEQQVSQRSDVSVSCACMQPTFEAQYDT